MSCHDYRVRWTLMDMSSLARVSASGLRNEVVPASDL